MIRRKTITVPAGATGHEDSLVVTCGPETAAKLGVPVGTVVDLGRVSAWYAFPPLSLLFSRDKSDRELFKTKFRLWREQDKISGGFDPERGVPTDARLILPT